MRQFTFLAKQGQHNRIARLLTENFGKPRLSLYDGERGQGVMIVLALPGDVSKRQVNRFLHSRNIPGSVSCRNKLRIIRCESWDTYTALDKVGHDEVFIWIDANEHRPRMQRAMVTLEYPYCTCCGPTSRIEVID